MEVIGLSEAKKKKHLSFFILEVVSVVALFFGVRHATTNEVQGTPITNLGIGHTYQVVGIMETLNADGSLELKLADNTTKGKNYVIPAKETSWIYLGVNITMLDDGGIREVPPKGPLVNHDS